MSGLQVTKCAPPHLAARRVSTYTVLGFVGYVLANVVGVLLADRWQLSLNERLIAFFTPGLAFVAVVTISKVLINHERIVFYQTTLAGIIAVVVLGVLTGTRVARLLDFVTVGIGRCQGSCRLSHRVRVARRLLAL